MTAWREWYRVRPDAVTVWRHPEVRRRLDWYYMVMKGRRLPKFILARRYKIPGLSYRDLASLGTGELFRLHQEAAQGFRSIIRRYRRDSEEAENIPTDGETSFLDVKIELAKRMASPCILCERRCGVDRRRRIGACRLDYKTYVHSAFLHLGEEAPLVPSGTIFYGGCNFTCVYCQNHDISQEHPRSAQPVSPRQLALIQDELYRRGARNINHVGGDPTPVSTR